MNNSRAGVVGVDVGDRIGAALERAGRDIGWLAEAVGVRWQTAQYWVQGRAEPKGRHVRRIAEVLGMDPGELLAIMEGQDPPFSAWAAFLSTDQGATMTADERISMQSIRWTRGRQPTVASYMLALTTLRSTEPRE